MHAHEHVGAELPCLARAATKRDEVIAIANQHRAHALFGVDRRGEPLRDRERHVLFARAAAPERTGILAAVACVDGNDEIASLRCRGDHLDWHA